MDIADVGLNAKEEDYFRFLDIISKSNFTYIYKDVVTIDIIEALLKNNLNVLQTSKFLYLHRNSILNKIEIIYKETGLNIQKFTNAYLVKQIICKR
jgi:carbohydrate diacid regulator